MPDELTPDESTADSSEMISVPQASRLLGRTPRQVRNYITSGILPATRVGWADEPPGDEPNTWRYRIPRQAVLDLRARGPQPVGYPSHKKNREVSSA